MIPLDLQNQIIDRVKEEFEGLRLKNLKNELVPINIFPQHLPAKNKENTDPYPCIIVRLADGDIADIYEPGIATIQFIIGVIDRESTFQGYRDAITVSNRIIENLQRNPIIDGKYQLLMPITWAYYDEDTEPYFFAGVETNWEVPTFIREDVEDLI